MTDTSATPAILDAWFDLECPDCQQAQADLRALRDRHGSALEVRLRHFPLEKHKHAYAAAQAAEEAYAQGSGEAYTTTVLNRVAELSARGEAVLLDVARELGLDADEVESALIDGRHLLIVDADQAEGRALGVTGTPTYVVNGEVLHGGKSQEGLRERITELVEQVTDA